MFRMHLVEVYRSSNRIIDTLDDLKIILLTEKYVKCNNDNRKRDTFEATVDL